MGVHRTLLLPALEAADSHLQHRGFSFAPLGFVHLGLGLETMKYGAFIGEFGTPNLGLQT